MFSEMGQLPTDVPNEDDQISFWGLINGGILCTSEKTVKYRVHENSASAWLRNKQSNKEYLSKYLKDMEIRRRHMMHWSSLLARSPVENKEELINALKIKAKFYDLMVNLKTKNYFERLEFFIRHSSLLPMREKVYCLLGENGIVVWRIIRNMIKGDK
jgi:hypothetical protein